MSDQALDSPPALKTTPLTGAHVAAGAKMVEFGGYSMPVQYREGVLKEHLWTRAHAGAFDVSHMGPSYLTLTAKSGDGDADHAAIAAVIEPLVSADIAGLKRGQVRYALLLAPDGGVLDDLMIGRPFAEAAQGMVQIIVNAGTKEADFARIAAAAGERARLERADDNALIAVQGPGAAAVVAGLLPQAAAMGFMTLRWLTYEGPNLEKCGLAVTRSGYTGEDGYEILVPRALAPAFWDRLLADEQVRPIGLGARDSLRLEAGLPLYGHDLDPSVSPVEGNLAFAVSKRRRKAADFPGAARILAELAGGPSRIRVGLRVLEGAPAREGAQIADGQGHVVGAVTSGGFSPTLSAPIAMGFVPPALAAPGTALKVIVRGKAQAAQVTDLPFVPHRYFRPA